MHKKRYFLYSIAIFVFSLLYFAWGIGNTSLWDIDEPIYAQALKEMIAHHNLLVPTFNNQLLPDKPILNYWLMWCGTQIFGWNSFGLRVGSAFVGALFILLLWIAVKRLYNPRIALFTAAITATLLHSSIIFRSATPDPLLILTVSAALLFFLIGYTENADKRFLMAFYIALALATLDKGPIGFLLPGLIIVLFLLGQKNLPFLWKAGQLRIGIPLFLLIVLPWYVAVGLETQWSWDKVFLIQQNIGRFDSSMQGHQGPWFYYLISILLGMLPWSLFFPQTFSLLRKLWPLANHESRRKHSFLLIWAVVWTAFFSLSATKLPSYVWESYPPLAIFLAWYFDQRLLMHNTKPSRLDWLSPVILFGIGVALSVFGGWILPKQEPQLPNLLLIGLPYSGAAIVAMVFLWRQNFRAALLSFATGALILSAMLVFLYTPEFNYLKPSREMGEEIAKIQQGAPYRLASWQWFQPDFLFYAGRGAMPIHHLTALDEIAPLAQQQPLYLVCPEIDLKNVQAAVPPPYHVALILVRFELYSREKIALLQIRKSSPMGHANG